MSKTLENLLRQGGLLTDRQLDRSLEQARRRKVPLIDVVLKDEHVSEDALAEALSKHLNIPRVRVAAAGIDPDAARKLPEKLARKHACLPMSVEGKTLVLAMANPSDYAAVQDVEFSTSLKVRPVVATYSEISDGIEELYLPEDRVGAFLANIPDVADLRIIEPGAMETEPVKGKSRPSAANTPVVKLSNLLIADAIRHGASEMQIDATLNDVQVRIRVDGALRDYTHLPKWLHGSLVSRLKVLAKMDVAQRRLPQEGKVAVSYQGKSLDLRISTQPTTFGEKLTIRLLGGGALPTVATLGLRPSHAALLRAAVSRPQGVIVVVGPAGSGKTTTLYAMLNHRRSPEVNIVTIEDPIEQELPGVNQVQVNTNAGLTYAGILRSILKQKPNVILVGETRDRETAGLAFQAATSGHMVLTTVRANSAIAAVARLYDLGVDPEALSDSLVLVVAQRLVRRICDTCRERFTPDHDTFARLGLTPRDAIPMFHGRGCPSCGETGYKGRTAIFEILRATPAIRQLIHDRAAEPELAKAAKQAHVKLLRAAALERIRDGITTPEEVLRVVQGGDESARCPKCQTPIQANLTTCPFCLQSLRTLCRGCGRELSVDWRECPYCNSNATVQSLAEPIGLPDEAPVSREEAPTGVPEAAREPASSELEAWYPGLQVIGFDDAPPPVDVADRLLALPLPPQSDADAVRPRIRARSGSARLCAGARWCKRGTRRGPADAVARPPYASAEGEAAANARRCRQDRIARVRAPARRQARRTADGDAGAEGGEGCGAAAGGPGRSPETICASGSTGSGSGSDRHARGARLPDHRGSQAPPGARRRR